MNVDKILKYSDGIYRADSLYQLKNILEMIKNVCSDSLYTISYSEKGFLFEWGLSNSCKSDSMRLFFGRSEEISMFLEEDEVGSLLNIESMVYPCILFAINVQIVMAVRTYPISELLEVPDFSNKIFRKLLQSRLMYSTCDNDYTKECIRKEIRSAYRNQNLCITLYNYFFDVPKKSDYTIFENSLPFFFQMSDEFWLCPRPGEGAYKIHV